MCVYMCARKRPQSGCKRLTKSSGTNARDVKGITGEWDWTSRSGLEDAFFFSLLHYTIAYGKSDVRWAISFVSVTSTPLPIAIYMIPTRSHMGERLRRGCPVNRPRRLREETRLEPIVSVGSQTHWHGLVWQGLSGRVGLQSVSRDNPTDLPRRCVRERDLRSRRSHVDLLVLLFPLHLLLTLLISRSSTSFLSLVSRLLPLPPTSCPPQVALRT